MSGGSDEESLHDLNSALQSYQRVLNLLPPDAVDDLAVTHNGLGTTYAFAGDLDPALPHYREAIRYQETQANLYGAASTRYNVALALARADRLADALEYAHTALSNFRTLGDGAAEEIQGTRELIAEIEQALQARAGAPTP